ncbi:glycosyltransferase [Paraflavitalea pollutisoli]|uniref:glycosyltransferase n=1 Tax=Paraflavitalea pollutisoli TaxID=3034143 RepID=UPI0023ED671D|nr:glycosyltransferase [Paraflavitalea sp. H1-2-19X]
MELAPIILFVYNRPEHTRQTVASLQKNHFASNSELFIYSDGPRSNDHRASVSQVRDYVAKITGFKQVKIVHREKNMGLAQNIKDGVTSMLKTYKNVIVLEDDMILSPYFLEYMNHSLQKYEQVEEVISIHGYCVPIQYPQATFFLRGADCWGWATWQRGWKLFNDDASLLLEKLTQQKLLYAFDLDGTYDYSGMLRHQIDGRVNSWAIKWYASAFLANKLTLYPAQSLVQNIGGDGSGTHLQNAEHNNTPLNNHRILLQDIPIEESYSARKLICQHHSKYQNLKGKLKRILKWGY